MASCIITPHGLRSTFDYITLELISLLVVSNILHFFLQRLGQPSIISQFLAGIIAGKSLLLRKTKLREESGGLVDYLDDVVRNCRVIFMFMIGLEMDIVYLRRNIHKSALVAVAGMATCTILALLMSSILYRLLASENAHFPLFILTISLFLSSTASPVLIHIVTELKLASSNIGKLAIASAIATDLTVIVVLAFYSIEKNYEHQDASSFEDRIIDLAKWLIGTALGVLFMTWMVKRCNGCHPEKRYISNVSLWTLMVIMAWISNAMDNLGYNSVSMSFIMGLLMPRKGHTTRAILEKLAFPVHYIIMPLFFSGLLVRMDLHDLVGKNGGKMIGTAFFIAMLSTVGKVTGTFLVARFVLRMRAKEGLVLGILLNVKGHLDTVIVVVGVNFELWSNKTLILLIFSIIIDTFIACPVARLIVLWERKAYRYNSQSLEHLTPDSQIRVLTCVHGQREVRGMLTLSSLCVGEDLASISVSLLHLVELTQRNTLTALYNQQSSHNSSWDRGIDDRKEVADAADTFSENSGITIQQLTALSSYKSMHEDVCMCAEELRACLVLLPFHKGQRYDGKMVCRRDERCQVNLQVFQHAPCTIGIFVDRSMAGGMSIRMPSINTSIRTARTSTIAADPETPEPITPSARLHQVVAIFFGGPDDREAASFMARTAQHPSVNATLVRFHLEMRGVHNNAWSSRCMNEFAMMDDLDKELELDVHFLAAYQQRYVASGAVNYTERYVTSAPETVTALSSMVGLFTLFIVGKGGPQFSSMLMGIRDWEECPELGPIGDLLASEDFMSSGSVLILQQHKVGKDKSKVTEDILR